MARALFVLAEENAARQALLRLCTHRWFDAFILAVIVGNAVMMATEDPTQPDLVEPARDAAEVACNIVFTLEMLVKVIAYGLVIGEDTYLRSGWNILDFVIVVTAWLPYFISSDTGTAALRTFRVLRPLRSISRFPGLKNLVVTIFMAAPQLQLLLIVVGLFFVTFGVVGIQLWKGKFRQRCQEPEGILQFCPVGDSNETELCPCAFESDNCGGAFCDLLDAQSCSAAGSGGSVCAEAPWNPYYDFASFDHIFSSWVIVLQCITTTSWQDVMHKSQATTGELAFLYFVMLVMLGAYFLLNLFVAVLKEKFSIASSVMIMSESLFAMLDDSGDGLLDKEELSAAFNSKGITLSMAELDTVYELIDEDGSGEIDTDEFALWLRSDHVLAQQMRRRLDLMEEAKAGASNLSVRDQAYMNDPATPVEERARLKLIATLQGGLDLVQLFQFHDRDETGELNLRQFKSMLRRDAGILPVIMGDVEIETVFAAVDVDQGGGIDVEEFTLWLNRTGHEPESPKQSLTEFMDAADNASQKDDRQSSDVTEQSKPEQKGAEIAPWQQSLQDLVESAPFSIFFVAMIIVNTVVLASDHHGISKELEDRLEYVNLWLTLLFAVELAVKIAAYQGDFHQDGFNVFDAMVVTTGLIELMIDSNTMSVFRIFRILRVLRVLRLVSYLKPLRTIARVIIVTTSGMTYIGILLCLFMFVFAICGMQLFGGQLFFARVGRPQWHFDTFPIAFMTCFQILNYDTWDRVMLDGMRAIGWEGSLYFILWVIVGALVLRNLLLVIILETYVNVSQNIAEEDDEVDEEDTQGQRKVQRVISQDSIDAYYGTQPIDEGGDSPAEDAMEDSLEMASCLIFSPNNPIRRVCVTVADSVLADYIILSCIVLNCITMSMDTPFLDPDSNLAASIYWSEFIFTVVFSAEALVKMIAYGIFVPVETAYLASGWNRLDFVILGVAWFDWFMASANVGSLKALRALRSLRLLNKIQGLRVLVLALVDALAGLTNMAGLTFIMWLIFGISCVSYLKGAFWSCNDTSDFVFGRDSCAGSVVMMDGTVTARSWSNAETNFDHIGNALFSLFEISMGQWHHVAHASIDAVGIDIQPRPGYNQAWTIPFMVFVLMSNLFFMSLFVGVIYEKYFQRKYAGLEELSKEQRDFLAIIEMISSRTFTPERGPAATVRAGLQGTCYSIATSSTLDNAILGAIVVNCTLMASTFHNEPQWWADTQFWMNQVFTLVFTFECAVKLIGLGWDQYWLDAWNRFDLIVVCGSWLDVFVTLLEVQFVNAALFRIIRVARVIGRLGRLFRGLKILSGIDTIVNTFISSLPALSYITLFIALEVFIFAVIAMNLFGRIKFNGCLDEHRNFQTVPTAMLTLFGMATKDAAVCMVHACMLETDCDQSLGECGDPLSARIFYVLFDFTIMVTTIEMFVNVILAKYEQWAEMDSLPVTVHHLRAFRDVWKTIDHDAERWIDHGDMQRLLDKLPRQLAFDELMGEEAIEVSELRLPSLPDGSKGGFLQPTSLETATVSSTTENGNEGAETSNPVFEVDSKSGDAPTELENQDQVFEVDSKPGESSEVRDDPIGRLGYNFYEVLYGLVDRKCGVPLPTDNVFCRKARLRMCLRIPSLRALAIKQSTGSAEEAKAGANSSGLGISRDPGQLDEWLELQSALADDTKLAATPRSPR